MAITFVGSDSGQQGANTTGITLTLPSHQTDDVGVIYGRADESGSVPSLSIGTATGWTELIQENPTSGRDRVEAIWYKRFTSGSETNPVLNISLAQEHSASVHVFRGVDTVDVFDAPLGSDSGSNDTTPVNSAIDASTDSPCLILFHGATHDDISVAGLPTTPSSLVLGETILGSTNDHRGQITAYQLDMGVAPGTITPTAWTHTSFPTATAEWTVYTILLRDLQPIHITDPVAGDSILEATSDTVDGDGFEATQGTGKVELWSNTAGSTKVTQTIDTWSATSIDVTWVKGALDDGVVYLVVTNDSGDESPKIPVSLGFGPYEPWVEPSEPDHFWTMNNVYDDEAQRSGVNRPCNVSQVGPPDFEATAICRTNSHSLRIDSATERTEVADSQWTNTSNTHSQRNIGGWLLLRNLVETPAAIYEEGGGVNNIYMLMMPNGRLAVNVADSNGAPDFKAQAYADFPLVIDRPYHVMIALDCVEATFRLWVDGEEQVATSNESSLGDTTMSTHSGDWTFGDPDANLDTGGVDIAYNAASEYLLAHWGTWCNTSGGNAPLSTAEIQDNLFRKGALAEHALSAGTQAAMQTAVEAFDTQTHADEPLTYDVPKPTSGSDLELTITDQVWPDEVKFQIRWIGAGTLTIRNSGTSNLSASKCWSPLGGSIVVIETASVTLTVRDLEDSSVVAGAQALVTAGSGGAATTLPFEESVTITRSGSTATVTHTAHNIPDGREVLIKGATQSDYNGVHVVAVTGVNSYTYTVAGTPTTPATGTITGTGVIINGSTDGAGEVAGEIDYFADQPLGGIVRKGSASKAFKPQPVAGTITAVGLAANVFLLTDES